MVAEIEVASEKRLDSRNGTEVNSAKGVVDAKAKEN